MLKSRLFFLILISLFSFIKSQEFITTDNLKRGMLLSSRTRMDGNEMVSFKLKILSVLKNSAPGEDAIMAEILNTNFRETGVVAGMSGSPVYYKGKLAGAIAYTSSFQKKPVVGITPIKSMLKLLEYEQQNRSNYYKKAAQIYGLQKIKTPLAVSGGLYLDNSMIRDILKQNNDNHFLLLPGGSSSNKNNTNQLQAGDACGINFVSGDLDISALGTVTYVSNNMLLAFGHPMQLGGKVNLPLYKASIDAAIPRLSLSYKLGTITSEIGRITEDRSAAVLGEIGTYAARVPVNVAINTPVQEKTLQYSVVKDKKYFSRYAILVIINSFLHYESVAEESRLAFEIIFHTDYKKKKVHIMDIISMKDNYKSLKALRAYLGSILNYIEYNRFLPINVTSIDLRLNLKNYIDYSYIDDVKYKKKVYHPGEKVNLNVLLKRYKQPLYKTNIILTIPDGLEDGLYPVMISSGYFYMSTDMYTSPFKYIPESPERFFELLNVDINEKTLAVWMYSPSEGCIIKGQQYKRLPVFQKDFILAAGNAKKAQLYNYTQHQIDLPFVVLGARMIRLEIRNIRYKSPQEN
ncbi:MAG TPA: SpoIVB peptidase S55 domain-containing protein [Spirochaetota bacterium]|nr:SpoIVB peptidase S55 domain-containing protein [Spirochaetota bacterium]